MKQVAQPYEVKPEDLIGKIKDFPIEIVQQMVNRQIEQGNPADIEIFQYDKSAGKAVGGFNWWSTREEHTFWARVISNKNFDIFFAKYPKVNVYPKVMLVSNDNENWEQRVVFMEKCNKFLAWIDAKTLKESELQCVVINWKYARELPKIVMITKKQIAEKFNTSVENLEII